MTIALTVLQDVVIAAFAGIFLAILLIRVVLPYLLRRNRSSHDEGRAWIEDRAWNQIQAASSMADFLEREDQDVREPRLKIEQALSKYDIKRFGDAQRLAQEATESLTAQRKKLRAERSSKPASTSPVGRTVVEPEPEPPTHRDLSGSREESGELSPAAGAGSRGRAEARYEKGATPPIPLPSAGHRPAALEVKGGDDPEVPPAEEPEEETIASERAKRPKDYMESRFMLTALKNDLAALPPERQGAPEVKEAGNWAQKGQACFDRKDYTESLRLAMRGRRLLGGAGISTISVGAGTVVDAPPSEASPTALRSSGPPPSGVVPGEAPSPTARVKLVCERCGRNNAPSDRFCRSCGAPVSPPKCPRCQKPVEPDDKFCHGCGAPLAGT